MSGKCGIVCSVIYCKNYTWQKDARSFFRFPKDKDRCAVWVNKCKREDSDKTFKSLDPEYLYKYNRVCSDHFQPMDFNNPNLKSQGLRRTAVPTLNLTAPSSVNVDERAERKKTQTSPRKRARAVSVCADETKVSDDLASISDMNNIIPLPGFNMEEEAPHKPEAVWLSQDENVVALIKAEHETSDTVLTSGLASNEWDSVKKEFIEGEEKEKCEHVIDDTEDTYTKIEIHDNSILEDCSGLISGFEGLQGEREITDDSTPGTGSDDEDIFEKKNYKCRYCFKCFTTIDDLVLHKRSHTEEKRFSCEYCGKCFKVPSQLSVHKRSHAKEKLFSCEYCKKGFNFQSHLTVHKRLHTGERPFCCEQCGKCFKAPSHLNVHMRSHTGERPFSCEYCGKCFSDPSHLSVHKRSHTGERPFSCEYCGKCFKVPSNLSVHKRSHTGGEPFSCEYCKKGFNSRSQLTVHKRSHTGEKPFSCEKCGKSFSRRSDLIRHSKLHLKD